ncbi:unnamed protein product [Trichobilharzia regenti]|nr:unnamed protein product [Trichobilharzia regenti]
MYSERLKDLEYRRIQEESSLTNFSNAEAGENYQESHDEQAVIADSGLGSVLIVRGLNFMTENLICEVTSLPNCSWVIVTPFYAASIVEVVQSDKASEPTTLLSCFRDGLYRLIHMPSSPRLGSAGSMFRSGPTVRSIPIATSRLLPVWRLFAPVVLLNVGHYVVKSFASIIALSYWNGYDDRLERDAEIDLNYKCC